MVIIIYGFLLIFNFLVMGVQVLPVMIMGAFIPGLRRKYPPHEYFSAVLLVVGLILFTLADAHTSPNFSVIGVVMVSGALVMDSFLGNFQEAIFTMNPETTQVFSQYFLTSLSPHILMDFQGIRVCSCRTSFFFFCFVCACLFSFLFFLEKPETEGFISTGLGHVCITAFLRGWKGITKPCTKNTFHGTCLCNSFFLLFSYGGGRKICWFRRKAKACGFSFPYTDAQTCLQQQNVFPVNCVSKFYLLFIYAK